jgi:CheY-like chemotaxis protein
VKSRPGEGTRFDVYLPEAMRILGGDDDALSWGRADEGGGVLVVDPEEAVRGKAVSMLGNLGYRALAVEDGATAVSVYRARHRQIDLVLLDLDLPGETGALVCALLAIDPRLRLVLMGSAERLHETQVEGAAGRLVKPFGISDLAALTGTSHSTATP